MMENSIEKSGQVPEKHKKHHYNYLQDLIKEKYMYLRDENPSKAKLVLRTKGKLSDPWNIAMFLSIILSVVGQWIWIQNETFFVLCLIADVLLFASIIFGDYIFCIMNIVSILVYIIAIVVALRLNNSEIDAVFFVAIEGAIAVTYFILRYQPQLKPFKIGIFKKSLYKKVFGIDIYNEFFNQ